VICSAPVPGGRLALTTLRLFAAALCHVLGHHEEGAQWLHDSAVPDLSRLEHMIQFVQAVLVASVGSAPRAVVGSEVHAAGEDGLRWVTRNTERAEEERSDGGSPVRPRGRCGGGACSCAHNDEMKGQ